ncbi:MAG: ATPase, T2SS/T4P/T4SS family [Eubacteriales bacterium]|nr:ATPase, T2SS/T4P/T4SS family [Eubacteriales bacterium]
MSENNRVINLKNIMYQRNIALATTNEAGAVSESDNYSEILEKVRQIITSNHSTELAEVLYKQGSENRLRNLIAKYLNSERLVSNRQGISELTDRIYEDMAGFAFLKKYLEDPDVEEININGFYGTWVLYNDRKILLDENFNSSEDCVSVIKKLSRFGGVILDGSSPVGDSFISKGVRMSSAIYPVVDQERGAIASIRKQKPASITRENLINYGTASEEELDFLVMCVNNGVSVAFAGSTGSGKTADMGYLLSTIDDNTRIVTIEDTQELQLERFDSNSKKLNDVIQLYTKDEPNPKTMLDLLKLSLRLHPTILVPAEMRGVEAMTVQEAGRTGHTIVSTLHAKGAKNAYDRILTMCLEKGSTLSEERLLEMIVEAFPIMVFKRQLKDGSRKYIEIFEATGVDNKVVTGNLLFKFKPGKVERDKDGRIIKINGMHQKVGQISKELAETLRINGVDEELLTKYTE